jgi:AhpD family alkylhydroperoxidase
MQARIKHFGTHHPEIRERVQALGVAVQKAGLPPKLAGLVHLRASQINGCSVCVDLHARAMKKEGETEERMMAVAAWSDAPYFTAPERAVLALTEHATRLADRSDPVPDAVWDEAARHFDEKTLAAIVMQIGLINMFNRLNVVTRQVAGIQAWEKVQAMDKAR